MRWRHLAITGGTSLAAAATFNALAARGVGPLDEPLGGEEGDFEWRGHRVAYSRLGAGRPLLLVHGIHAGAWAVEWRALAPRLAASHTVYALDLLGFGRSDRPAIRYAASLFQQLVADFVGRVIGEPTVLVAASLSATHAILLAARDAERIPAVVLSVPTGLAQLRDAPTVTADALRLLLETPVVGTAMYNALVTKPAIRHVLAPLFARPELVPDDLVASYHASAHRPGAKHALAALVSGQLNADVRPALRRLLQPALVLWGAQARQAPVEQAHGFRVLKPDLRLAVLPRCGDLPHLEQPAEAAALIEAFLAERRGPRVIPIRGRRVG